MNSRIGDVGVVTYKSCYFIRFESVHDTLMDTCQWLRHLILTTQSIILPQGQIGYSIH